MGTKLTRRAFLDLAARTSVAFGLSGFAVNRLAQAAESLATGRAPVIWLQAQACSGCSISTINVVNPDPAELITRHLSLQFHPTLSAAAGRSALDVVDQWAGGDRGYVLVVEGAIPTGMPDACVLGGEPIADIVTRAARRADAVVAVGSCAAWGGIPAAEGNPTGAGSVPRHLVSEDVETPVLRVPGCPVHPDWLVGTLVHVLEFGIPPVDLLGRPLAYFSRILHEQCPRFADYERERFAENFGDPGCLFKLGCLGPRTHADCTIRAWNGGAGSCINVGAPCSGCASEDFAKRKARAIFRLNEQDDKEVVG